MKYMDKHSLNAEISSKNCKSGWQALSVALLASGSMAISDSASAQTEQVSSSDGIEDIIVTAQKREASLQDTPISIAVLGGDALEQRGISSVNDLGAGAVPSLRIVPFIGRASALTIGMRGIVPVDATQISRDPTVGIYVDGVYLGRVQGLGTELFDIDRIEVLRGPQGTLFGRNAVGGALSIVSKKPTGEWGGSVSAGVRNFDGYKIEGHLDLPAIAGISIKLDGVWNKRDGWVQNPLAGAADWNQINRRGLHATALWQPSDDIDVQYSYDLSRDESTGGYQQLTELLPGAPPLAPIASLEPRRVRSAGAGFILEPSIADVEGHSLNIGWEALQGLTIRSITAYRGLTQSQFDNTGFGFTAFRPNGTLARTSLANVKQDQFSQEIQFVGTSERLDYVAGLFYFDEDARDDAYAPFTARYNATGTAFTTLATPSGGTPPDRASVAHAKSTALFGQATWTPPLLGDRLHITGGLRWTHDRKHGALTKLRGATVDIPFAFRSKRLDPAATIAFDWNDDINSYLRWGTAYRAGGANSRSATFRAFAEEEVETWEFGLKADLFDRRLRTNLAAYHTRFRDMQMDYPNPSNPSNTETVNSGQPATIKGIEIDVTAAPVAGLTLNASYAYTHWKVLPQVNPFTNVAQARMIAFTPAHAASLAADYRVQAFDFGALSAHVDANYSSGYFSHGSDPTKTRPYWQINGRLALGEIRFGETGPEAEIALWGKNLTNEQHEIFDFVLSGTGLINGNTVYFNEPRTYGLDLRLRF